MRLIITRHGETIHNIHGIVQGHIHGKLTEKGKEQARKLAVRLKKEKIDYIYSSDLQRARETTKEISKLHKEAKIIYDKRIRERDYKIYAGLHKDEVNWNEADNEHEPEKIEPLKDLRKRLNEFHHEILEKHIDDTVLIVSHGTAARLFIGLILGKTIQESLKEKLKNTSLNIIEIDEDKNHEVHVMNCVDHLAD
jgi:broad specificity phosphatase PhoE